MIIDHSCVGVDEVGRGPLAGPVVAAAVLIPETALPFLNGINDSKKLTKKKREQLAPHIIEHCECSIVEKNVAVIDQVNILQATKLAMIEAIANVTEQSRQANSVCIDGNFIVDSALSASCLVKGDMKHVSIAAASIIAKVYRDELMAELAKTHPHYGWETNAGYGTKQHLEGLQAHGITPHHRKSFEPIKSMAQLSLCPNEKVYA